MADLLTISEAAEILNMSEPTLRRAADRGEVPSARLPFGRGDRRFDRDVIEKIAEKIRAEAAGAS